MAQFQRLLSTISWTSLILLVHHLPLRIRSLFLKVFNLILDGIEWNFASSPDFATSPVYFTQQCNHSIGRSSPSYLQRHLPSTLQRLEKFTYNPFQARHDGLQLWCLI